MKLRAKTVIVVGAVLIALILAGLVVSRISAAEESHPSSSVPA